MPKSRVLVVDDSAFMRRVISDIIKGAADLEVCGTAKNGLDALDKIRQLDPDVVTMDVEMPQMDGIATLEIIMRDFARPVVMLSSLTRAGADETIKALTIGAVDFIAKPSGQISLDIETVKEEIVAKVRAAAAIRPRMAVLRKMYEKAGKQEPARAETVKAAPVRVPSSAGAGVGSVPLNRLVVIGTSTGGPKALHEVITRLPANLGAGVLIVQHMPPNFTRSLAERLNNLSQIQVKEAEQGEIVLPGHVYIAPGDFHLNVIQQNDTNGRKLLIQLSKNPPRGSLRPSVDDMFESVARHYWSKIVGVIMTGMGTDGTEGIRFIKEKGATIIAEDQSTCVVYGMPKSAIEAGLVDRVVPLPRISDEIVRLL